MIEKRMGLTGPCPECEGRGRFGYIVVINGEPDVEEPRGCATCGKVGGGVKIIVDASEPETAGGFR